MNYQNIIQNIYKSILTKNNPGQLATYIPELSKINPNKFGVHINTLSGQDFGIGNFNEKFSVQSIAKVLSLCLAYKLLGEDLWARVDVEPSGTKFNSLLQLENDNGIPRNPFINSGAIVICDVLISHLDSPREELFKFINSLSKTSDIKYSSRIANSEKSVGYRNIALGNYLKALGNLNNEPNVVLDLYFDLCSLELSCEELSSVFTFLANNGETEHGEAIITKSQSKRINAIMQTCGFYDESGEFSYRVGLPGKSGVGGGIIAVLPNNYTIAVWSPKLNPNGNSSRGMLFLEEFTTLSEESIF